MDLSRLSLLIGKININKIKKLNILVLGLGGVGGYTVESLIRCGVEKITLVDGDLIKPSNLNRQIISNSKNINKYKTREFKKRIKLINKDAKVSIINTFITEDNMYLLFMDEYDYIVDACDTLKVKILLIKECLKRKVNLISSMGTANKLNGGALNITTLNKTTYDPLAKKIRKEFSERDQKKIKVVSSTETIKNKEGLGSIVYVPAISGLLITNHIINETLKNKNWQLWIFRYNKPY